jgi:hypothetical protein
MARRRPHRAAARAGKPFKRNGVKNGTEQEYENLHLRARQAAGEVAEWWYEGITLKLGAELRYTPDYLVLLANGELEVVEVKGSFVRDDARAKLIAAAERYPFRFYMAQKQAKKHGGGWIITEINADTWTEAEAA